MNGTDIWYILMESGIAVSREETKIGSLKFSGFQVSGFQPGKVGLEAAKYTTDCQ